MIFDTIFNFMLTIYSLSVIMTLLLTGYYLFISKVDFPFLFKTSLMISFILYVVCIAMVLVRNRIIIHC